MIKKIFVNPGDTIQVHIIEDKDKPKNISTYKELNLIRKAMRVPIKIKSIDYISFIKGLTPAISLIDNNENIIKYLI